MELNILITDKNDADDLPLAHAYLP
jgi:hypothetical protein